MFGGISETAHGHAAPNIERLLWHIGEDRVLRAERSFRAPLPPIPGTAEVLAADIIGRYARVLLVTGAIRRWDSQRRAGQWVESVSLIEPAPRLTTPPTAAIHGRDRTGRFARQEVPMLDEPVATPALTVGGFSRRSLPMEGVALVAWAITADRRLLVLDVESGRRNAIGGPVPGEQPIIAADPFAARALLDSGEVLKWTPRGWFRDFVLGEPAQAEQA